MLTAGVASATDYVTYGTVLVEETHLDRRKVELDAQQLELESRQAAMDVAKQAAHKVADEKDLELKRVRQIANEKLGEAKSRVENLEKKTDTLLG